ncbi:Hypothetical protein GLP15_70 [Giardia lamblia P15]|uniref:Uncharacterized protein n=1 Tax=Giardia intestinalis (strain P15) TaxID=658858 RepID=E1F8E9_GIAIA|nr:Hypothetical protein GLP15_70 [Giardia lamblia P15]
MEENILIVIERPMEHVSIDEVRASMKAFIEALDGGTPSRDDALVWCGAVGSNDSTSDDVILILQIIRKMHSCATASEQTVQLPELFLLGFPQVAVSTIHERFPRHNTLVAELITILNVTATSVASLTICLTTSLEALLLEFVLSNVDFIDTIAGTVVMLDLLDLLAKLSHVETARKKIFSDSRFIRFINYVSASIIEEISTTNTFVDLLFEEPSKDPQDSRNLADFQSVFLHNMDAQYKLLTYQRLCGCAYVVSLSSNKFANMIASTRVPALSFELVSKIIEISSLGVLQVSKELAGPLQSLNKTLAGALATVISLFRSKHNLKVMRHYDFLPLVVEILRLYSQKDHESIISNEICSFSCMLLSSLSALSKQFAERMYQMHVLSLLVDIVSTCTISEMVVVFRSAMSSLVDLSNTLRGTFGFSRMKPLIEDMQAHTTPPCTDITDLINNLVGSFSHYTDDDEAVLYFAEFVRLYTSGSVAYDFVRHAMLAANVSQLLLDSCSSDNLVIAVKTQCMHAIAKLLRVKTPSADELLVLIPKVLSFTPAFMKTCAKKAEDPYADLTSEHKSSIPMHNPSYEYRKCVSACKEVLEVLGHAEGRNKIKYIMYSMLFTGITFMIVYVVVLLFPDMFKRPYFDQ